MKYKSDESTENGVVVRDENELERSRNLLDFFGPCEIDRKQPPIAFTDRKNLFRFLTLKWAILVTF